MIKTTGPYITTPPHWTVIHGFFDYQDVYEEFARRAVDGDVLVEVGCYLGRSACFLGEALQAKGVKATLIAVDVWPATYVFADDSGIVTEAPFETFYANVRQSGLLEYVVPLRVPSLRATNLVRDNLAAVWIDAEHDYANCLADIRAWLPKVRPGGVIAGHDYDEGTFPGVGKAVREVFGSNYKVLNRSWWVQL